MQTPIDLSSNYFQDYQRITMEQINTISFSGVSPFGRSYTVSVEKPITAAKMQKALDEGASIVDTLDYSQKKLPVLQERFPYRLDEGDHHVLMSPPASIGKFKPKNKVIVPSKKMMRKKVVKVEKPDTFIQDCDACASMWEEEMDHEFEINAFYRDHHKSLAFQVCNGTSYVVPAAHGEPCIDSIRAFMRAISNGQWYNIYRRYEGHYAWEAWNNVIVSERLYKYIEYVRSKTDHEGRYDENAFLDWIFNVKRQEMDAAAVVTTEDNSTSVTQGTIPVEENNYEEVISLDKLVEVSTEQDFVPEQLMNRWIRLDTFVWDSAGIGGSDTRTYVLPYALGATTSTLCESLVTSIWQLNRTQRMGMEVRTICPAQPYISGKMVKKFYYESACDMDISSRFNKYSMSHGKNVGIRPGAKTAACLHVGFNNRNAAFSNQTTAYDREGVLNLGTLVYTVMNNLKSGAANLPRIDVSVEIRFVNTAFHGRIPSSLLTTPKAPAAQEGLISDVVNSSVAKPYVDTVSDIEKMLNSVRTTDNEDKPPEPKNKTVVIPRFAESFSAGTGIGETLLPLRLDIAGRKPAILKSGNGGDLSAICCDPGLYKQTTWSTSMERGTTLIEFPIEPVNEPSVYDEIIYGDSIGSAMPPLDIMASNFVFFSGNIMYKIEVVSTSFHNGAIAVFMVPLVDAEDVGDVSINSLSNVKRHIIELGVSTSEMVVQSDFHNLNPIFATRSSDRFSRTPRRSMGKFILKVSSILQTNPSASSTIDINIYKYAAPDFKLFEVKNAILSPIFDAPLLPNTTDYWVPNSGNKDWYAGNYNEFFNGTMPCLRFGALVGEVEIWAPSNGNKAVAQIIRNPPTETQAWFEIKGLIRNSFLNDNTYRFRRVITFRYLTSVYSELVAIPYIEEYYSPNGTWEPMTNGNPGFFSQYRTAWNAVMDNPSQENLDIFKNFILITTNETQYFGTGFSSGNEGTHMFNLGDLLNVDMMQEGDVNSDNAIISAVIPGNAHTKISSMDVFGEEGGDIISILRRPIYRATFNYNPSKDLKWPYSHISLNTSHFFRPTSYSDPVNFSNRWSVHGIIQTCYLWVSGSLSRRIMGPSIANTNMWVNHKVFDKPYSDVFSTTITNNINSQPSVFAQGLAYEMSSLEINSHMNVGIPWKQENVRNVLARRPAVMLDKGIGQCYDLGRMEVGFQSLTSSTVDEDYTFSVFDSYGDDCELSGYRGFPPMVFNNQLEIESVPLGVMRQEGLVDFMVGSALDDKLGKVKREFREDILDLIKEGGDSASHAIVTKIETLVANIQAEFSTLTMSKVATVLAGEGMHMMANPSKKTLLICFLNTFLQLGFFTQAVFSSLITEIGRLINSDKPEENSRKQEGDVENDLIGSILSLLAAGVCSYIGWSSKALQSVDWKTKFAFTFPSLLASSWSMKRFMTSFFPMFQWVWETVLRMKVYICDEVESGFIDASKNTLTRWVKEVRDLTRPGKDFSTSVERDRVIVANAIGGMIELKVLSKTNRYSWFRDYINRIRALNDKLTSEGATPYIRVEPFSIWMYGGAGVGKSHLSDSLTSHLIVKNNIPVPDEKTLIVSPTSKYLNRIKNQPVMHIDDFMAVVSPEFSAAQLSYVFDVMTCAAYNPNQAVAERKDELYAPKIFSICANSIYPAGLEVRDPSAFLRRRDVTIKVEGNVAYLEEKFGQDFLELQSQPGFVFGKLPAKMREDNLHLRFTFETVDISKLEAKAIKIDGRIHHTYAQMLDIVQEEYVSVTASRQSSYKSRIAEFWLVKGVEVPDFNELLDLENEPCLSVMVGKWLAQYENDKKEEIKMDRILKKCGYSNLSPRLRSVYEERYDHKAPEGLGTDYRELFMRPFTKPELVEEMIKVHKMEPVWGPVPSCNGESLLYSLLQKAPCLHRCSGDPARDIEVLLAMEECTSDCIFVMEHRTELLVDLASRGVSPAQRSRVKQWAMSIPNTLENIFAYASRCLKLTFAKIYSGIKFCGVSIWDFVKDHWGALAACVTGAFGLWYLLIKDAEEDSYIMKYMPDGTMLTKAGVPFNYIKDKAKGFVSYWRPGKEQEGYNPKVKTVAARTTAARQEGSNNIEDVQRLSRDAYVLLLCDMDDEWISHKGSNRYITHVFCYGGRKTIMIRHCYEIMKKHAKRIMALMHTKEGVPFTVELASEDLVWQGFSHYDVRDNYLRHGNFGIVNMPAQFPSRRTLIRNKNGKVVSSLFQTEHTVNSGSGILLTPPLLCEKGMSTYVHHLDYRHSTVAQRTSPVSHSISGKDMTSATVYSNNYEYPASKQGYCLGVLIDEGSGKIVGMHYCGDGKTGMAEKITCNMLEPDIFEYEEMNFDEPNDSFDVINSAILPLGHSKVRHQQSGDTAIQPSTLHGIFEVTTEPAILKPNDERNIENWSPLYAGVRKHGLPPRPFPSAHLRIAKEDYANKLRTMRPVEMHNDKARLVTIQEAVFGVPGVYNSMDFTTSLGYGWKEFQGNGKHAVVNPETKWMHPEVLRKVDEMITKFKSGVVPFVLSVDCLKDETLKKSKVKVPGSTRIISTMPFEYQIVLRLVTMPFVLAHQTNNFAMEHAIGISVMGQRDMEFDRLGKRLEGGKIVAGDFSNFGPGASNQVATLAIDLISEWYGWNGYDSEYVKFVRCVLEVLISTPHLCYDKVYKTSCGIISGSGVTVVLNSMIHSLYMRIAALGMNISMVDYNNGVELYTYGDDGIAKVHDSVVERFNVKTLQEFFKLYDIKYTSVDKDDNVIPYCKLSETSFLKHVFRLDGGIYKAALDKKSIENQINWVSKKGNKHENTVVNAEMALRQAYAHGSEYYDYMRGKLLEGFAANGRHVTLFTYDEMDTLRSNAESSSLYLTDTMFDAIMG